ncbi:MAG: asparaginase, partial [Sneathiella sp.]
MIKHSSDDFARPPFTVAVSRGDMVESRHQVIAAISDSQGRLVKSWGYVDSPVYLRSAIKPLQALPLIESGAAEAFNLSEQELSLACASHTGEQIHVDAIKSWLNRIGLDITD